MHHVSEFFGIGIRMAFSERAPPHFRAWYGGREALVGIEALEVLGGGLPARALGMVQEWAALHQHALRRNWERARERRPLAYIQPLE